MAEYPKEQIAKLDATAGKEAWELIGLYALDMVVTFAGLYIIGYLANSML
jgi:hypothetical protein